MAASFKNYKEYLGDLIGGSLRNFDEQLKHYAEMRITLDLDDGVKTNYGKFGNLLADVKAIHGKAVKLYD